MSMSKKDYEMIGAVLETHSNRSQEIILELGYAFAEENPNFRWDMWLTAAGFTGTDYVTKVDSLGNIANPGKFEGEAVYMPIAYDGYLCGCDESDNPEYIEVAVIYGGKERVVRFVEAHQGFIIEIPADAVEAS